MPDFNLIFSLFSAIYCPALIVPTMFSIYCPALIVPENGAISTTKVNYLTLVHVTCNNGFMFPDRNLTTLLQCVDLPGTSFLAWNDTNSNCTRKYTWVTLSD